MWPDSMLIRPDCQIEQGIDLIISYDDVELTSKVNPSSDLTNLRMRVFWQGVLEVSC